MGESSQSTLVSGKRAHATEERRAAYERLLFIACFIWPPFGVLDVLGAKLSGHEQSLAALITLRCIGALLLVFAYGAVRFGNLGSAALTAVDVTTCVFLGIFVSIIGVEHGGIDGLDFAGIILIVVARTALVPSHWLRATLTAGAAACTWPGVMLFESIFVPDLRAQWASSHAVGGFLYGSLFILGALALCTAGSHAQWRARLQVHQARRLGNYRLKMRIGAGGNGDVWIARQDALHRDVALKVLKEHSGLDEEKIRRFEREARAAASLAHPNTIRIFEFGASDDGVLFIAMELLDGLDVDALVEVSGPLPAARAVKLIRQACASLAEAHVKGIVHRDIKPANLFVTHAGEDYDFIKLLDFGVARFAEDGKSLTETGILFGTPAYMSPEVCAGERASTRSDVYSLGAVLYFMLTATPLFPDRTFAETVMSHISKTPEPPSARLGKPLPQRLEMAVMKCLQKKRDDRFRSVKELDELLASIEDLGDWSHDDAEAWWTGAKASVTMRVRGVA